MTQWTAFLGVTGLVLSLFLALARLSQSAVRGADPPAEPDTADARSLPDADATATATDSPPSAASDAAGADTAVLESNREGGEGTADAVGGRPARHDVGASPPVRDGPRSRGDDAPPVRTTDSGTESRAGPTAGTNRRPDPDGDEGDATPVAATTPATVERERHSSVRAADLSPGVLLANVALTQGVFGGLVAAAAVYFAVPGSALGLSGAPLSTGLPAVAVGVVFGVVLWIGNELASVLASAAGVGYDERLRELLAPESIGGWVLLLGVVLPVVAGVEEFLFRAAVIGVPAAAYGTSPWALALVSSLAFALGHGAQGRTGVVVTGGLGLALAAGFVLTNSLLVVVIAHYLVNALELLVHEGFGVERPLR